MPTTNEVGSYIYILINESLPGLIKVGMTTKSPHVRARELHTTGIPTPFKVAAFWSVPANELKSLERKAHTLLKKYRVSDDREFFRIDVDLAKQTLTRMIPSPEQRQIERENRLKRELERRKEEQHLLEDRRAELMVQRSDVLQKIARLDQAIEQRENPWFKIFHFLFGFIITISRSVIGISGWAILIFIMAHARKHDIKFPGAIFTMALWLGLPPFLKTIFDPLINRLERIKEQLEPTHAMKRSKVAELNYELEKLDRSIAQDPLF